jgi:hypothetical protein
MSGDIIAVVYGATPSDKGEAKYNKLTAEEVGAALERLGLKNKLLGLSSYDGRDVVTNKVFNLCDGDDPEDRFEIVSFAREIEGKSFTGSNADVLSLAKDKTLSWATGFSIPRYWDLPPVDLGIEFIAKPRFAHGSLLITKRNIGGAGEFLGGDYFFQEYHGGAEYTVCFLGSQFLGTCQLSNSGIITRDDKWETSSVLTRPSRHWDLNGFEYPDVRKEAMKAWTQLLTNAGSPLELAYGRVDLRRGLDGRLYVIDLNPNAYLGKDGLLYSCWSAQGGSYEKLIALIATPLTF